MDDECKRIIREEIAPVVQSGRAVLFLGAGYSVGTTTITNNTIPIGYELIDRIIKQAGIIDAEANKVDLETAFAVGEDEIPDFKAFLKSQFKCKEVLDWHITPFYHWWRRIYTTNIDDVIDVSVSKVVSRVKYGPKFKIYNYKDRAPAIMNPIEPPIVYLHGKIDELDSGVVFDGVSYADHTIKSGDWLHDAALHLSYGHCIILGSKLKESDLEAELRKRTLWEDDSVVGKLRLNPNWIILKDFNPVEIMGYRKRGLIPLKATAEEFFTYLSLYLTQMTDADFLKSIAPHLQIEPKDSHAIAWFNQSFNHVPTVVKKAKLAQGIHSRFYTGDFPDWFYIVNSVHAEFDYQHTLIDKINKYLAESSGSSVYLVTVTGPVASGKTTLCRSVLYSISQTIDAVYDYDSLEGVDIEHLWDTVKNVKGPIVLYLDKSSEHFYAINEISKRFINNKHDAKLVILIEEREVLYQKNKHHLFAIPETSSYNLKVPPLTVSNANKLVTAIRSVGLDTGKLKGKSTGAAAKIICDTERGFRGDLLATLCEVTGNKSFKEQLDDEFTEITSIESKNIFKLITIVSAARLTTPISYISEILGLSVSTIVDLVNTELDGKIYVHTGAFNISSRHPIIAEYHIQHIMNYDQKEDMIVKLMQCVSNKYTVKEIKNHPLPYRIYKAVLHHYFLRDYVFSKDISRIESVYSKCQSMFVNDGIFWLQYGRYLYLEERYKESEHCFRKGLSIYDSFQIRHALGQVLFKLYIETNCRDKSLLDEGISLLTAEIASRGNNDPYPYTTLGHGIMDVLQVCNDPELVKTWKQYANEGMKYNRLDDAFQGMIKRGIVMGLLSV